MINLGKSTIAGVYLKNKIKKLFLVAVVVAFFATLFIHSDPSFAYGLENTELILSFGAMVFLVFMGFVLITMFFLIPSLIKAKKRIVLEMILGITGLVLFIALMLIPFPNEIVDIVAPICLILILLSGLIFFIHLLVILRKKIPVYDDVVKEVKKEKGKKAKKQFIKKTRIVAKLKNPIQFIKAIDNEYKPCLEKIFAKEVAHMHSIQQKAQKLNEFGVNEDKFYKVFYGSNLRYIFILIKALLLSKETMPVFNETSRQVYISKGKKAQIKFILNAYKRSKNGHFDEVYSLLKAEKEYYKTIEDIAWTTEQFEEKSRKIILGYALFDKMTATKDAKKRVTNLYRVRDYKVLNELYDKFNPQVEEYKNNIIAKEGLVKTTLEHDGKGTFDGLLLEKIGLNILCTIVNVFTLFIAYPATICWKQKWFKSHTIYDGKRLSFDGNGMQLFGKWVLWLFLSVFTLGIFYIFLPNRVEAWKSKHTHVNGEIKNLGGTFDGSTIGRLGIKILCFAVNLFTLFICKPFTICWKQKWLAKHTVYDGKRLSFDGNGIQLIGKWILWIFLTVITFGIYGLFVSLRMEKWKAKHTHLSKDYEYVL